MALRCLPIIISNIRITVESRGSEDHNVPPRANTKGFETGYVDTVQHGVHLRHPIVSHIATADCWSRHSPSRGRTLTCESPIPRPPRPAQVRAGATARCRPAGPGVPPNRAPAPPGQGASRPPVLPWLCSAPPLAPPDSSGSPRFSEERDAPPLAPPFSNRIPVPQRINNDVQPSGPALLPIRLNLEPLDSLLPCPHAMPSYPALRTPQAMGGHQRRFPADDP